MKITKRIWHISDEELTFAKQMGVNHAIVSVPEHHDAFSWEFDGMLRLIRYFESFGLEIAALGSPPVGLMTEIKLAGPERDAAIDKLCGYIQNMGKLGISVLGYNFSLLPNWGYWRRGLQGGGRGGAGSVSFDYDLVKAAPLTELGIVSSEVVWERLTYFLQEVVPVAEKAGVKLACHPDDPPVPSNRGIAMAQNSIESFQRLIDTVPSPCNGLTFCVGTTAEMGADIVQAVHGFGAQKKIFCVHFRNVRCQPGPALKYEEVFHDEGDVDLLSVMQAFYDVGYDGLLDPDHAPVVVGETSEYGRHRGYAFAYGYIAALRRCVEAAHYQPTQG